MIILVMKVVTGVVSRGADDGCTKTVVMVVVILVVVVMTAVMVMVITIVVALMVIVMIVVVTGYWGSVSKHEETWNKL